MATYIGPERTSLQALYSSVCGLRQGGNDPRDRQAGNGATFTWNKDVSQHLPGGVKDSRAYARGLLVTCEYFR